MAITHGTCYLRCKQNYILVYKLNLNCVDGKTYFLEGERIISENVYGDSGLTHRSPLNITVYRSTEHNRKSKTSATGTLKVPLQDFAKQISTLTITNYEHQPYVQLFWKQKIGQLFAPSLWDTYSGLAVSKQLCTSLPARVKRPLKLNEAIPIPYKVMTHDQIFLRLKRYQGGSRGPVLLIHDLGVSSSIFSLDTIETNLVEYLFQCHYDVWVLDWRASADLQYSQCQFFLQEAAKYDIPAAVDKILEEVKEVTSVQIVAQGIGSVIVFLGLLSGNLHRRKVRSLVTSQTATSFVSSDAPSHVMKGLHTPEMIDALRDYEVPMDTSFNSNWFDQLMQNIKKMWVAVTTPYKDCGSTTCHRINFMYGSVMHHENINLQTHSSLHELFGYCHSSIFKELAHCFINGFLIRPEVLFKLKLHLNLPICFIHSADNGCYGKQSSFATYSLLIDAYPEQNYEHHLIQGYGHLDCIIGQNADKDVYPIILNSLDQYNRNTDFEWPVRAVSSGLDARPWLGGYDTKDTVSRAVHAELKQRLSQ